MGKCFLSVLMQFLCMFGIAQTNMVVNLKDGTRQSFRIEQVENVVFEDDHEAVDLGLSVKWATCNVGAEKPEDYGLYFAWGDTTGYTSDTGDGKSFDGLNYKWLINNMDFFSKYCANSSYGTVDNKTILESSDDAATANWSGSWRMPTEAEWTELMEKCTWTWTNLTGVNGYKVTSTNGNYIFLPAAGYRYSTFYENAGSIGYYWSSSLCPERSDYARFLYFYNWNNITVVNYLRVGGKSVRPVYSKI